jgi:uncharacterized membrane protein (DUF4010 family)
MTSGDPRSLFVALATGLLLGLEREWSKRDEAPHNMAGSRTFAVAACLGALARFHSLMMVGISVGVVALFGLAGYLRSTDEDIGLTTELALVASVLIGSLAVDDERLSVMVAVVLAALLASRDRIHRFARELLTKREVEEAILFFVAAFVILPLLPSGPRGPYGVLDPARIWRMVVLVVGVGLAGHIATRLVGTTKGLLVAGLAGGFVTGAGTTASMAARARQHLGKGKTPGDAVLVDGLLGGALAASVSTLAQLAIVVTSTNETVSQRLAPTVIAGATALSALIAILTLRRNRRTQSPSPGQETEHLSDAAQPPQDEPSFRLLSALAIAAGITIVLLAVSWATDRFGTNGAIVVAGLAGFADVHAASISVATLAAQGTITAQQATAAIGMALVSNTITKFGLAAASGGHRFGARYAAFMIVPILSSATAFFLST